MVEKVNLGAPVQKMVDIERRYAAAVITEWATSVGAGTRHTCRWYIGEKAKMKVPDHWTTIFKQTYTNFNNRGMEEYGEECYAGIFEVSENTRVMIEAIQYSSVEMSLLILTNNAEEIKDIVTLLRLLNPEEKKEDSRVSIVLCCAKTEENDGVFTRKISVPKWDEIKGNYTGDVPSKFEQLLNSDINGSRLMIFRGDPGTGKTWAIRSLISEWRDKADFLYVTDPVAFLGEHTSYLLSVMFKGDHDKPKVIILEDCGEFITVNAKQQAGQSLSRLLNMTDGIFGQGLNMTVLISTNEKIEKFHPAITRNGRCLMNLEFGSLCNGVATEWLTAHNVPIPTPIKKCYTLAELYALKNGAEITTNNVEPILGFK